MLSRFSVRYDKGGSEKKFGMFGYGDCALLDMNYSGQVYTIWDLARWPTGVLNGMRFESF